MNIAPYALTSFGFVFLAGAQTVNEHFTAGLFLTIGICWLVYRNDTKGNQI